MSAIARYFKFRGYEVSGYDRTPSELTAELEKEGIAIHYEDNPEYVPENAAETTYIREQRRRMFRFSGRNLEKLRKQSAYSAERCSGGGSR